MPVTIPQSITVHLGGPNEDAQNVTVPFVDYIKNVASSEIYPTWPESALRANILAQISFALNRVFTEYYRARGYSYDITSSTAFDQKYTPGRDIFENVSLLVDQIFSDYIVRRGSIVPLFAQYCNGTTTTCNGLSQWGSVTLANNGLIPYEILQNYYGENINLVRNAPVAEISPSYPGIPLKLGDVGENVRIVQQQLVRIARNYPNITPPEINGVFDVITQQAVVTFQETFDLQVNGIVGKDTWYAIKRIFAAVTRLAELTAEPIAPEDVRPLFPSDLSIGDVGQEVRIIQYYLAVISFFDPALTFQEPTGSFTEATESLVKEFQAAVDLPQTGIVDLATWNAIITAYENILSNLPDDFLEFQDELYPGRVLSPGITGDDVRKLQEFLNQAAERDPDLLTVAVDGIYGPETERAVRLFRQMYGFPEGNTVGPLIWSALVRLARGTPVDQAPYPFY